MIDYYTAKSLGGNTRKISIMLAETELEHVVHFIDLNSGVQHEPWYRAINSNGKIPALVDNAVAGGHALAESGAILIYLAEKAGRFLPRDEPARSMALQWVFWQVGGVGPMFGQWSYFARQAPEKVRFAIDRYRDECRRLLEVLDQQLEGRDFIAGDYGIADMANYSWIGPGYRSFQQVDRATADGWRNLPRWLDRVSERPAVALAMSRYEGSALRIGRDCPPLD